MATSHEPTAKAEARINAENVREAIKNRMSAIKMMVVRDTRKWYTHGPRTVAHNRAIGILRAERNEHDENFNLLLNIVEATANAGSTDAINIMLEFVEAYNASF